MKNKYRQLQLMGISFISTVQMSGKKVPYVTAINVIIPFSTRVNANHIYNHKFHSSHFLHNMPPYQKRYHHWLECHCPPDICLPLVYDALWHPSRATQEIAISHTNPTEFNLIQEVCRQRNRVDLALEQQVFRPHPITGYW